MTTLLTVEEAAARIHPTFAVSTVRAAIRSGDLLAKRIGKRYFITEAELERFITCPSTARPPASTSGPTPTSPARTSNGPAVLDRMIKEARLKIKSRS